MHDRLDKFKQFFEGKDKVYRVIQYVAAALMLVFFVTRFQGNHISSADFEDVRLAVLENVDMSNMQEARNTMLKRLYGLSTGDFDNVILYYPTTNMGAEEIFLVKLSDVSQKDAVLAAIESRLAAQKKSFDGYGVEQTELLNNCVIDAPGNYILYVVHPDAKQIAKNFERSI